MLTNYLLMLPVTIFGALGSYFFKKATKQSRSIFGLLLESSLYFGGVIYLISIVIYLFLLNKFPLTRLLPLTSLTYVWSLWLASWKLKEKIGKEKIIGIICIIFGAIIVSLS
jgi:uncharacterized membrane protein